MLTAPLERHDMQGLLVSAYAHLPCAEYRLLEVTDAQRARTALGRLADSVTSADHAQAGWSLNLAFTHDGLRALGLADDALRTFPLAFQDGMASARCSRVLGDHGDDAPERWRWGGPTTRAAHVLLMLYAARESTMRELVAIRAPGDADGLRLVARLDAGRQPDDNREHFGFVDGVGQPVLAGSGRHERQVRRTGHATDLAAGEFVLGRPDEHGEVPPTPTVWCTNATRHLAPVQGADDRRDLGRNGSYLVFRHVQQDVAGFWLAMRDHAARLWPDAPDPIRLAAKLVGRWPSGAPLVLYPDADPAPADWHGPVHQRPRNDFDYRDGDPYGHRCPLGAHVRRANPRDALGDDGARALRETRRHRLLRRGRSYGDRIEDPFTRDGKDRGLYFVCLNADIERQFEFVQQTWLNNPAFADLPGEVDPLAGARGRSGTSPFSVHAEPLRACVPALRSYVHVRGGAYFFLPGLGALRALTAP